MFHEFANMIYSFGIKTFKNLVIHKYVINNISIDKLNFLIYH